MLSPVTDLKVTNITTNSISVSFTGSDGAVKYGVFAIQDKQESESYLETTETNATLTGLKSGTKYDIAVVAIDSNGTNSDFAYSFDVTTLVQSVTTIEQATTLINVDDNAKIGFVYVNVNETAKKARTIYVNVNGTAKKCIKK